MQLCNCFPMPLPCWSPKSASLPVNPHHISICFLCSEQSLQQLLQPYRGHNGYPHLGALHFWCSSAVGQTALQTAPKRGLRRAVAENPEDPANPGRVWHVSGGCDALPGGCDTPSGGYGTLQMLQALLLLMRSPSSTSPILLRSSASSLSLRRALRMS